MRRTASFAVLPNGTVEVTADEGLLRHFRAEYGAPDSSRPVRVAISIDDRLPFGVDGDLHGRHKTVNWSVSLDDPDADALRATLALRGHPRWFGVSLVQGFILEPLISMASVVEGLVLLPAAAVAETGGALLMIGRSQSGKSSISTRALALGRQVLGDDQVLIEPTGRISPFPRRIRIYDDLLETSPMAVRVLPLRARLGLHLRRVARIATHGFVAPSLALPHSAFGGGPGVVAMRVHRIVVVRRDASAREITMEPMEHAAVHSEAMTVLRQQRSRLSHVQREDWQTLLRSVVEREAAMLAAALRSAPAYHVTVPEAWGAPSAVEALARVLDIS